MGYVRYTDPYRCRSIPGKRPAAHDHLDRSLYGRRCMRRPLLADLRYDYHVQAATLSHALRGQSVGVKWSNELCRATKIPFNKLFDTIEKKEPYAWETNNKIKRTVRAVLSLAKKNRLVEDNFAQADYGSS